MRTTREEGRRRLGPERRQDVDHQRHDRRRRRSSGRRLEDGIRGFLVEKGTQGLHRARAEAQVLAARLGHLRAVLAGRARPGGATCCPRRRGPQGPARLPDAGALRHRLGRLGAADGLLRRGARVHQGAHHVRQADRRASSWCRTKLADMLTEITKGQLLALQLGRLKDAGKLQARAGLAWPSATTCAIALDIARACARHARRQRHHGRVPGHAPHVQPRVGQHLRGHARHPHARARRGA